MERRFDEIIEEIYAKDPRYKPDAYEFLMESLHFTQKRRGRKERTQKHVSGEELLNGIKNLLLEKFGPMALNVLNHWGIKGTEDFGNVVFNLVENKVLSKTEEDTIESFKNAYDFIEVFETGYKRQLAKKISRMRPS